MKRIVWLSVLVATLLCAGLLSAQEVGGPKIEVREVKYDFGKVAQGTPASHVFEVRNTGTETLIIEKVQTS